MPAGNRREQVAPEFLDDNAPPGQEILKLLQKKQKAVFIADAIKLVILVNNLQFIVHNRYLSPYLAEKEFNSFLQALQIVTS